MRSLARFFRFAGAAILLVVATLAATSVPAAAAAPAATIKYLEVQADASTLKLSWDHVGGTIDSYEIQYRPVGSTTWTWSGSSSVGADYGSWVPYVPGQSTYTREFRATGITPGKSYEITVRTVPVSGDSSDRDLSKVVVKTNPPLGTLSTSATASGDLTVSWPAYTATPFHQYDLYLREGNGTPSWKTFNASAGTTSHTFTGLTPGALYTVGVRVSQSQARLNDAPIKWVRSELKTATRRIPSNELFYANAPHTFVSTATDTPFVANGVNIKRTAHKKNGTWETPYVLSELTKMGAAGAPNFNTVRLAMDWSYFQKKVGSSIVIDEDAFTQLDRLIDEAIAQDLYVILDPMHLSNVGSASNPNSAMCQEDPAMSGAHKGVPAWAWAKVGGTPGTSCETTSGWDNLNDDALALQETADYLKFVLNRYNGSTSRGQHVIAVDLVNEPAADGTNTVNRMQKLVDNVYGPWLAPSGPKSLRAADPDKILIVTPIAGSGSIKGVNLAPVARPNVALTFHDYFGQATGTDATHGLGYGASGYATQKEDTDQTTNSVMGGTYIPYNPASKAYATRKAEHTTFVQQAVSAATAADMPLYIGEYGIMNPCNGGNLAYSTRYAQDTADIYNTFGLSRTAWTNGYWDDMALLWREAGSCGNVPQGSYFPYAADLAGGTR